MRIPALPRKPLPERDLCGLFFNRANICRYVYFRSLIDLKVKPHLIAARNKRTINLIRSKKGYRALITKTVSSLVIRNIIPRHLFILYDLFFGRIF